MTNSHFLYLIVITLISFSFVEGDDVSIENKEGVVINVKVLNIEKERVQIEMEEGHVIWLDRNVLSEKSDQLLTDRMQISKNSHLEMNTVLGLDLFVDDHLWDDGSASVAKRLDWPVESKTERQSSFRLYPRADYKIAGCRPYSSVLYGNEGQPELVSVVFANKGDFRFSEVPTEEEVERMEDAIKEDAGRIRITLSEFLGEPEIQQFGTGRGMKQLVERWDWKNHSFVLASKSGEYVSLRIMTTAVADDKGRGEKLSDAALRDVAKANLERRGNGDVVIENIPMVDQGPKGYCVPATFERYLRYMQIPADMYILAMAGQTKVGGGTSLPVIIDSIESYVSSQSRSMKELKEPIEVRAVKKYIDKGLPIIWVMFSSKTYNKFVNQRTRERTQNGDWADWIERTKSESRSLELSRDFMAAHACMIVGYNRETDEIAVSDSWGPSYRERWVPAEQAEQVSQGRIYLIEF